jgi:hypothetical protein
VESEAVARDTGSQLPSAGEPLFVHEKAAPADVMAEPMPSPELENNAQAESAPVTAGMYCLVRDLLLAKREHSGVLNTVAVGIGFIF